MDLELLLGMFFTLGVVVMALAILMVYRVYGEVRRHRLVAMRLEERLAAFRHAVDVASREG